MLLQPTIVIVDDDHNAVELLEYNFSKNGFKTICFSKSKEAILFLLKNKVDLIITDWMMPELDGIDLLRQVSKSINSDTKKIMVSCISDQESIKEARKMGADDFIVKPLRVREFLNYVKEAMS